MKWIFCRHKGVGQNLKSQIRRHPVTAAVYFVLRIIVLGMLAINLLERDYESAFICLLSLVLFLVPAFVEKQFRIDIPSLMEVVILLFIFAAEILGELNNYYGQFPYWDTMLHTTNGFVCAAFGFSLIDILTRNKQEKFRLSPLYVSLVAFCFSMTVGVMWEFFEYGMDMLFQTDMQKDTIVQSIATVGVDPHGRMTVFEDIQSMSINGQQLPVQGYLDIGLHDTMADLFVNFIGAVVFSVLGFFYIRHRGKGRSGHLMKLLLPSVEEETEEKPEITATTE